MPSTCARFSLIVAAIALLLTIALQAPAQTFQVIHTFTGGGDGASPQAGLIADRAGNLYGTATAGGMTGGNCPSQGCGTVFRLKSSGGGWILTPLYQFQGGTDGYYPQARLVFGANGWLYGTTVFGGGNQCHNFSCGTAFKLTSRPTVCRSVQCPWTETVIHRFAPPPDAGNPSGGPLVFDPAGNLYGIAGGGCCEEGVVYELTPSGGGWSENVIYDFTNDNPLSGVILDPAGNLYGTDMGAFGYGGVYQLTYSGSSWSRHQLYSILNTPEDGYLALGGLVQDGSGNLYGTTTQSGRRDGGTVFELSAGSWTYGVQYALDGSLGGGGPEESLAMDAAGNLYGTTYSEGAYTKGSVFKLSPSPGGWIYTDLHDFTGGSDGAIPISNVVIDAQGNLYGTTSEGGSGPCSHGCGVVWEITP